MRRTNLQWDDVRFWQQLAIHLSNADRDIRRCRSGGCSLLADDGIGRNSDGFWISPGKGEELVVCKPDRLSRSSLMYSRIVDRLGESRTRRSSLAEAIGEDDAPYAMVDEVWGAFRDVFGTYTETAV